MKFSSSLTVAEIAHFLGVSFKGNSKQKVVGINEIHVVEKDELVFVDHPKYYQKALDSKASVILINKDVAFPEGKSILISEDPFRDFNKLTKHYKRFEVSNSHIHPETKIGKNTHIQPGVFIGKNVVIGDNCLIHSNVSINSDCTLGNNVIIQSNTVLSSDAFYYKKRPEGYDRLLSGGNLIIENDVEIGANCTIDKGVSGSTRIGTGSKVDNLVQIGHDTVIGKNCLIAALCAIAGCVVIGDNVTIWGQVGIASGLKIGDEATVLGQSGITHNLKSGKKYFGTPAEEARVKYKEMAKLKRLTQD